MFFFVSWVHDFGLLLFSISFSAVLSLYCHSFVGIVINSGAFLLFGVQCLGCSFLRRPIGPCILLVWFGVLPESVVSVVSRESALGDICVMTCTRAPSAGHSGGGSKQTRVAIMLITRRADAARPANSPDIVGSLPIRRVIPMPVATGGGGRGGGGLSPPWKNLSPPLAGLGCPP